MKVLKILFLAVFSVVTITSCNSKTNASTKINKSNLESAKSRDTKIKESVASIEFDRNIHNFGTVDEGFMVETVFKVTNSGNTDLVITDAKVTCGCTVPSWPKEPIKPGETKDIKVRFNTSGKPNRQQKNITLITNTESGREILTLKGMVTPKTSI